MKQGFPDNASELQALRSRVAELEALLRIVPMGLAIATDPQASTIESNPYLADILGVALDANISLTAPPDQQPAFRLRKDGQDIPPEELPLQQVAASGVQLEDAGLEVVRPDGQIRHIFCRTSWPGSLRAQGIAVATNRLDDARAATGLDLLSQPRHCHVHEVRALRRGVAPNPLGKLAAGEGMPWLAHEDRQQLILGRSEVEQCLVLAHLQCRLVQLQRTEFQYWSVFPGPLGRFLLSQHLRLEPL